MAAGRRRSHRRWGRRLPGRRGRSRTARYGNGKRWLAVWLDPDGRERSKAFATKTAADDHWQAQATDVSRGDYLDANAGKVLVASLGPQWLTSRRVDPATLIRYESAYRIRVEPKFGQRRVRSIRPSEIAQFTSTLDDRYGPSTANLGLLVVGGILELALADGALKQNSARSKVVQRPSTSRPNIVAWADATVTALIDAHPPSFRPIPAIGAGLRTPSGRDLRIRCRGHRQRRPGDPHPPPGQEARFAVRLRPAEERPGARRRCRPGSQQSQRPTPHVTHRRPTHCRGSIPTAIRSPSTSSSGGPTTCTSAPAGTTS